MFLKQVLGKDVRTTWELGYEMTKWINKYFKLYKESAARVVDLEFHKIAFEGKEYTQVEIIDMVIELSETLLKNWFTWDEEEAKEREVIKDRMFKLLSAVHFYMWW